MFGRRSPDQIRAMEVGDRFARTFFVTFGLTFLCYPIVLSSVSAPDGEGSSGIVIAAWLFGLPFAVKAFLIGMITSALVFFPVYRLLKSAVSNRFAAPLAASVSIFLAVFVAVHTHFGLSPIRVYWDVGPHGYEFARSLGISAAIVAAIVARLAWIGADPRA